MPWRRVDTASVSGNDWLGYRLIVHGSLSPQDRIIEKIEVYGLDDGPAKGLELTWRSPVPGGGCGYMSITARFACGSWALAVINDGRRIVLVRTGPDPSFQPPNRAPDPRVYCCEVVLSDAPAH